VGFLLLPRFAMMPFTAAVETLRAANRVSGKALYRWRLHSDDGHAVTASNGIAVMPEVGLSRGGWPDLLLVCGGLDAHRYDRTTTLSWLRLAERQGTQVGAISSGTHVLARAGLLAGRRCTVHWEDLAALKEAFPDLEVSGAIFESDQGRWTCAGGTAALDMMLHYVAGAQGDRLAAAVASIFIHDRVRTPGDEQPLAHRIHLRNRSPRLAAALRLMESHIEEPLPAAEIAARVQVSPRQLERLFRRHLGCPPRRHYLELRLGHARRLLLQTGLSVMEVALASGFASQSYFTKCYRDLFRLTPGMERRGVTAPTLPPSG
jgi:AraC family transcriptional regulator, glycine betaine-responsive activator